jgi:hypothetical protein
VIVSIGDLDPRDIRVTRHNGRVDIRIAPDVHLSLDSEYQLRAVVDRLSRDVAHQAARERAAHETAA